MKFIFPKNYNFNNKLLGFLDYSTVIVNIIWALFLFSLFNLIFKSIDIKIFLFVIFYLPLAIFSIIGFNHENILYVALYVIKFLRNPKIYLYNKSNM